MLLLLALAAPPAFTLGSPDLRHGGVVRCVAFSPDGKRLASAGHDRLVSVWDVETRKEVTRLADHEGDVTSVAWSPDGKRLATGCADGSVRLWDVGGKLLHTTTFEDAVSAVAFAPDGRSLAAGNGLSVVVIDVPTWRMKAAFGRERAVTAVVWSPDGAEVACNGAAFHVATRKERSLTNPHDNAVTWVGKRLVSWQPGGTVGVWDAATGHALRAVRSGLGTGEVSGVNAMLYQIAFDGDRIAVGTTTGHVRVWAADGEPGEAWKGHTGRVSAVAMRGKVVASGGADGAVRLWDAATGKPLSPTADIDRPVIGLSSDGKRLAVTVEVGRARTYDLVGRKWAGDGRPEPSRATVEDDGALWLRGPDGKPRVRCELTAKHGTPVLSPTGAYLTALTGAAEVALLSGRSGRVIRTVPGHRGGTAAAAFSGDERVLITGGRDRMLRFWDTDTGAARMSPRPHPERITAVAAGGPFVASATADGWVQLRSLRGGLVMERRAHRGPVNALAFGGGMLFSGGADATVNAWDVSKLDPTRLAALDLTATQREEAWAALRDGDGGAIERLARGGEGILPLLARVRPVPIGATARWLRDIESDEFDVRDAAEQGLRRLGPPCARKLELALAGKPSADLKRRLGAVLAGLERGPTGEHLRELRTIEVLELIGTPRAEYAVRILASGSAEAELTLRARSAVERLRR